MRSPALSVAAKQRAALADKLSGAHVHEIAGLAKLTGGRFGTGKHRRDTLRDVQRDLTDGLDGESSPIRRRVAEMISPARGADLVDEDEEDLAGAAYVNRELARSTDLSRVFKLNLRKAAIRSAGIFVLSSKAAALTSLQKLYLSSAKLDTGACIALSGCLAHLAALTELFLDHNEIDDLGVVSLADASALPKLKRLEVIRLDFNKIGDSGAVALSNSIRGLSQLRDIFLAYNAIGSRGAVALGSAMGSLPLLEDLYLSHNPMGDVGFLAIARQLPSFRNIASLQFSSLGITGESAEAIVDAIRALPKLAYLTIDDNDFDAVGQAALIRAAKAHPVLDATLDFEAPEPRQSLNHGYGPDGCSEACSEGACAVQ